MSQRKLRLSILMILATSLYACSEPQDRGLIQGQALPPVVVKERAQRQATLRPDAESRILFGDLHVHTTFSPDAFMMAAPITGGGGLQPPADACDFARYCSALDFWSINDHAEGLTPRRWAETRASIRECNASAGDPANPDLVAFLGWEWSQVSTDPTTHYGHKNVIFLDTEEGAVPSRAICAPRQRLAQAPIGRGAQLMMSLTDFDNRDFYLGIQRYYDEIAATPVCDPERAGRELPDSCMETAGDPRELFTRLDAWGYDTIVIPHGNTWGMNTPAGTRFDKQLTPQQHDPGKQLLFEIYSGHGNAEEYRRWRAAVRGDAGGWVCPEPWDDYMPCCHRAGQIIRQRCEAEGETAAECQRREFEARQNFVDAGVSGHLTVPGQQVVDWLNCGTCPDCFNEAMDHRPATSAQAALAITGFGRQQEPLNFRFGFIGSSDNHRSQPGTGYKEVARKFMTESFGVENPRFARRVGDQRDPVAVSLAQDADNSVGLENARNMERQNSFWLTGGLVAAHSRGRDRHAIWDSLKRREVYATSGDRILLWFDLLDEGDVRPMGSEVSLAGNPRFRVSAVGAFKQQAGCPEYAYRGLGAARVASLCAGHCYNPGGERWHMDRIEIVRIRRQRYPGDPIDELIEDPWRSFDCDRQQVQCTAEFIDETFAQQRGEVVYYARAVQETSAMINADNLRCEYDEQGNCVAVNPCYGDYRTPAEEDCLAPAQQRAWSSPIFVSPVKEAP